jgi:hypothetical protein
MNTSVTYRSKKLKKMKLIVEENLTLIQNSIINCRNAPLQQHNTNYVKNWQHLQAGSYFCSNQNLLTAVFWVMRPCCLAVVTSVSEEHITSDFTSTLKLKAKCSSAVLVTTYKIIQHHNPKTKINIFTATKTSDLFNQYLFHIDGSNVKFISLLPSVSVTIAVSEPVLTGTTTWYVITTDMGQNKHSLTTSSVHPPIPNFIKLG